MGPHDALDDMESEAAPVALGGDVGLENPIGKGWIDSAAGVADTDPDMGIIAPGNDPELPLASHRLKAVADHIVEGLADLVPIEGDRRKILARECLNDDSSVLDLLAEEVDALEHECVEVGGTRLQRGGADRLEEPRDDLIESRDLRAGNPHGFPKFLHPGLVGCTLAEIALDELELDVEGVERIADLVGDSRREQGDGRETLALDCLLGLLTLGCDIAQDDGPADQRLPFRSGLVAHQRGDVEVQEAPFGIKDFEITAHHIAASGHGVEIESGNRRREIPAHVLRAGEAEESAGRPVHVDDVILRVGNNDSLKDGVEDRLEESLLLREELEVVPEVGRFDEADPLDQFVDKSPVHGVSVLFPFPLTPRRSWGVSGVLAPAGARLVRQRAARRGRAPR